ncbi:efflux RND transporter periplasmic adaptor subunit [Chryseobacterium fluminis]|uniref:efflux RND transporter periplasmic adaptor subunit n=1 Tax=Chryseobacterium fluminis TaxID=2983606 RepID=UPI00225B24C4|nr:efflux RND transporter periplasmic adaptor subunit [Chryseobacterium sp. MMS21-Ot14]UZT99061.1 efflux RND transporter periplasmic adaptor subunit [Chryseobacterium sp. MMS21-Ot14]
MKRLPIIIAAVLTIGFITYKLYLNKQEINNSTASKETVDLRIPVTVSKVLQYTPSSALKKTGNIAPFKQATVFTSTAGNVQRINFELGTKVSAGQLMAVTDPQKINIDLQNAISKEKKLQNELNTYIELLQGKATTQEKVNQIRLDYTDAKNQSALLRRQISDTRILAPITGIITEKTVENGVYVNGGTEIAKIVNLNKVKVQVYLTDSEVYQVKMNDHTKITNEVFPDRIFDGKITFISPQGDATHSYLVEMTVDNPDNNLLKSGSFVYVDFIAHDIATSLVINREALLQNSENPAVYVVQNNKAIRRSIRTGMDFGDQVEVLSGLSSGEIIVVSGQINLKDQSKIKVTNNKKFK